MFDDEIFKKKKLTIGKQTANERVMEVIRILTDEKALFPHIPAKDNFRAEIIEDVLSKKISIGGPLLANVGRIRSTGACTVMSVDFRKNLKNQLEPILSQGSGIGFNLSDSVDPVKDLNLLNEVYKDIHTNSKKSSSRKGAGMAIINIEHPKASEFISCKLEEDFNNWWFNISINLSSKFIKAVNKGNLNSDKLLTEIAQSIHYCGEPGILFMDKFEKDNPLPHIKYESVAPCAEIALSQGEKCRFSYINLSRLVDNGKIDYAELVRLSKNMTRFLDNSLEYSDMENATKDNARKIGIGICGFADMLAQMQISYGSDEACAVAENIMSVINFYSKVESVELAKERGVFPQFKQSRYLDKEWVTRFSSNETDLITNDMWKRLGDAILKHGIRNATTTSLPPTGNSASRVGASHSIEPYFNLKTMTGEINPIFVDICRQYHGNIYSGEIIAEVQKSGNLGGIHVDPRLAEVFKTAQAISPSEQLKIVNAFQKHIDGAISKTVNVSNETSINDIKLLLINAMNSNSKGITLFRANCLFERTAGHQADADRTIAK